jgi:hypothetical protein
LDESNKRVTFGAHPNGCFWKECDIDNLRMNYISPSLQNVPRVDPDAGMSQALR